jgi:NAD(P)-dependent dehydrogenase (short-subunit alcohol dehydrogenase family)
MEKDDTKKFSKEEWDTAMKVLKVLSRHPGEAIDVNTLKGLVTKLYTRAKKENKRLLREEGSALNEQLKAQTVIYQGTPVDETSYVEPVAGFTGYKKLGIAEKCYICKRSYFHLHFHYHLLCPVCAELNYSKRFQRTDLAGRTALITGGRIKIGYNTALLMLRDGARVIITTRFPRDCAQRFSEENDFAQWNHRLQIHGLDLRNLPAVERFTAHLLETESKLDIIINNAAQTIKRPLAFYRHLLDKESVPHHALPAAIRSLLPGGQEEILLAESSTWHLSAGILEKYFPAGVLDKDGQQIDLRESNSWAERLHEVSTVEMLEVQLVNSVSPFIINSRLKPLLLRSEFKRRFIVNVSAMEGQFSRESKTIFHPHTNMAKAALNMMTRTSAADYAEDGIYMNSVDTGWITQENPYPKKLRLRTGGFVPPLDIVDGAARIYDPVVAGINDPATPLYGHFLKDYLPHPW